MEIIIKLDYWQACQYLAPKGYTIKSENRTAHLGNHGGVEKVTTQEMVALKNGISLPLDVVVQHEMQEEIINKIN